MIYVSVLISHNKRTKDKRRHHKMDSQQEPKTVPVVTPSSDDVFGDRDSSAVSTNPRVNFSSVIEDEDHRILPVDDPTREDAGGCGILPGCRGDNTSRHPHNSSISYFQRVVGGSGHILNDLVKL